MSQVSRLYADEDFPHPVIKELIVIGHDVLTCLDDGQAGQKISDLLILSRATEFGRAILDSQSFRFFQTAHDR